MPDRDDYRDVYEKIVTLTERVDTIEDSVTDLKSEKADKSRIKKINSEVSDMMETLEDTVETLEEVEERLEDVEGVNDELNSLKRLLKERRRKIEGKISNANDRIEHLEDKVENGGIENEKINPSNNDLQELCKLPKSTREKNISSKPLLRAVSVYENFDKWAEYTPKGYIIKSGDLKRYLDEDLSWSQLYRVMEEFAKNTNTDYAYIDHNKFGKAIIRFND